jgi:hypothetical protein
MLLIFSLVVIPFQFTFQSLVNIVTVPRQIYEIATNERLRANHALEHATINTIEEQYGPQRLAGLAREDGFLIRGAADPALVERYARLGLERLQRGESYLAIHERCGTSIASANVISSVVFLALLFQTGLFTLWNVILAMLIANLTGPLLGRLVQKFLTTSAQVDNVEIVGVEYEYQRKDFFGVMYERQPTDFFIRTRFVR